MKETMKFKIVQQETHKEILIATHRDISPVIKEVMLTTEELVEYVVSKDKEEFINNLIKNG